jgi:uncharacterized protein YoxC
MSILSVLGSIVGVIGKVVGVAGSIFRVARPILEAMRPAIDEVDEAMDWLEENAATVGEESDDFLDRNQKTIADLEAVSARGQVVFGLINELAASLRIASQETTPDRITEDEAARFVELFGEIKDALVPWRVELDASLASLKEAEG